MKIFIAGARNISALDDNIKTKLCSIQENNYDVLVGDCRGVDSIVQTYYKENSYRNVTVFATNGAARNNIGNWHVESVKAPPGARGFKFYAQKDAAMADEADYGFMIWDGVSRGTLNNILNLIERGKKSFVYIPRFRKGVVISDAERLSQLVGICPSKTGDLYKSLLNEDIHKQISI